MVKAAYMKALWELPRPNGDLASLHCYWQLIEDKIIRGNGPTAVKSKLGYLLSGPVHSRGTKTNTVLHVATNLKQEETDMNSFWELESIGIRDDPQATESAADYELYRSTKIEFHGNRYVAKLPWKPDHPPLPTNFSISETRTRSMVNRLSGDLRSTYDKIIQEQERKGFIEKVIDDDTSQGHYLPHHPVKKDSETTPIRIVYDCSCKAGNGVSLNDCLSTGTPLLNDLVSILIRFRVHRYALSADIEKAFLQIGLHEDDRNFTKFLWLSDCNNPNSDFDVYRFKSVLFGAVSSPFILNTVVRSHLEANGSDVCQDLKENIYVDNAMSGAQTREDILNYHNEANEVMSKGGFNLRSWASNCTELRDLAREQGNLDSETTVNALGLLWNTESDKLSYKQKVMEDGHLATKREVVRSTASIYDPLGFLAPVHVTAKCFIQELWKRDTQWDEPLPQSLSDAWCTLRDELSAATSNFSIDRKYFGCTDSCREPYELHVFGDASTKAFCARRSIPRYMISDNATTYECAADELKTLFNSPAVKSYLANRRIDWKFIPKRAPWFGGFYERLIGITKIALKKVLGRSYVTFDELQTVVTEIEAIINDRPLTYTSSDFDDPQPLTPSHLLHGRQLTGLPYDTPDIEQLEDPTYGVTKSALQKRSDLLAKLLSHFWQRWSREYLTSLRERDSLNTTKGTTENVINVGDIVLVEDNRVPRMKWNLAVVENLNYGNDNLVRSAEIKTKFGRTNRPIKKLYPILELGTDIDGNNLCDLNSFETNDDQTDCKESKTVTQPDKLTRAAAKKARQCIKKWTHDLLK
ncbi:uncharacterized protein [Ptychodera flava]|uniref:uncharacterized protein n=1 Tax=Ptychodera flava TaxID=63121 RepID=UPI003969F12B